MEGSVEYRLLRPTKGPVHNGQQRAVRLAVSCLVVAGLGIAQVSRRSAGDGATLLQSAGTAAQSSPTTAMDEETACASAVAAARAYVAGLPEPPSVRQQRSRPLSYWTKGARAEACASHEVVFEVRHLNVDALEMALIDASTPTSANYRKFWSADRVAALTTDPAHARDVVAMLDRAGVDATTTARGEFVTAHGRVAAWEALFGCVMYDYTDDGSSDSEAGRRTLARCDAAAGVFTVPEAAVEQSVHAIYGVVDLPARRMGAAQATRLGTVAEAARGGDVADVTPTVLQAFYEVPTVPISAEAALATQSVFESDRQNYSPSDLSLFETYFGLAPSTMADVGGYDSVATCLAREENCVEANLDVQYITAIAPGATTTYFYVDLGTTDPFVDYARQLAAQDPPILVNSISYGSYEAEVSNSSMASFNYAVMKLGLMGGTVLVASGDSGVANTIHTADQCGYMPSYPATSPYVTAVGATANPVGWAEAGVGEEVSQADANSIITSGGGFSEYFANPAWAEAAVADYLSLDRGKTAVPGFNGAGRAYPDLALSGANYEVVIGDALYAVSGTSCSAPAVAGLVSLVNMVRLSAGEAPVGFLNPTLYASNGSFATDIVDGANNCASATVCCDEGFDAKRGWDPTTGWGSVNYPNFEALLLADLDPDAVAKAKAKLNYVPATPR